MFKKFAFAFAFAFLAASSFAQSFGYNNVPAQQARNDLNTRLGVVIDVQRVEIEVPASDQTRAIAGVLGGLIGALASKSSGWESRAAAASIGGVVGERLGNHFSKEKRAAAQIVVVTPDRNMITIVQEMESNAIQVGDPVFLVGSYPAVRAVRAPNI